MIDLTSTVTLVEVLWTIAAVVDLYLHAHLFRMAHSDLMQARERDPHSIVATIAYGIRRTESVRIQFQSLWVCLGIFSMTAMTSVSPTRAFFFAAFGWWLVAAELQDCWASYLALRDREAILRRLGAAPGGGSAR